MSQTREPDQSKSMYLSARIASLCTLMLGLGKNKKNQTLAEVSETSVVLVVL